MVKMGVRFLINVFSNIFFCRGKYFKIVFIIKNVKKGVKNMLLNILILNY